MEPSRLGPSVEDLAPDVERQAIPRSARRSRAAGTEAPIRSLLASGRLATLFQPIFFLAGVEAGACVGFEALTRGPEGSDLGGADALFAAVRRARLEIDADRLCLSLALAQARSLPKLDLMVNVHLETLLRDDAFLRHVLHSAAMTGVATSRLVLEIVEYHTATDFADLGQAIKRLRDAGVRIALDDLGAGHLQLGLIRHVSPDLIKLDRRLLGAPRPLDDMQRLLASFAATARRIGAQAVVEGVETAEHVELVAAAGVPLVQGYLFGRPQAASDLALAVRQEAPPVILRQPRQEPPGDWLALDRLGIAALLVDDRHRLVATTRAARDLAAPLPPIGGVLEPLAADPLADGWELPAPGAVVQVTPLGHGLPGGLRMLSLSSAAASGATPLGNPLPRPAWLELDLGGTIRSTSERAAEVFAQTGRAELVGRRLDEVWSCPEPLATMLQTAAIAGVWQADGAARGARRTSWLSLAIEPVHDTGECLRGYAASCVDVGANIRTGEVAQASRARLAVVSRLLQAALEDREPEELTAMATASIAELLPGRTVALVAVSEDGRLAGPIQQSPPSQHPVSFRMPRSELEVLRRGEPVIVRDVSADPRTYGYAAELLAGGVAAYADLPAVSRDHLFGVLRLASPAPHRWSPPELAGLGEVALAFALALRRRQDRAAREQLVAAHEARVGQVGQQVALIQSAPDGMALFDARGRLTFANSAFCRMLEQTEGKAGRGWWELDLHQSDEVARIRAEALPRLATDGWWRGEVEALRGGRHPFPAELTLIRRADQGYGCILRDLAPQRDLVSAVHASRSLLAHVTDAMPGALFRLKGNATGTPDLEFLSAAPRRLLDLPPNAPEPDLPTLVRAVLADDGGRLATALEAARAGQPAAVEVRIRTATGRVKWLHCAATPSLTDHGLAWDGLASDISEQKAVEQELWRARSEWRATVDGVADMIVLEDSAGHLLRCNQAVARTLGRSFQSLIGRDVAGLLLGAAAAGTDPAVLRLPTATLQLPASGDWYEVTNFELPAHSRAIAAWVHVLRNVTAQRRSEEEARRLEAAISEARDAVVVIGRRGVIEYANRAFGHIAGCSVAEARGKSLPNLGLAWHDHQQAMAVARRLLRGEPWNGVIQLQPADGAPRDFEVSLSPLVDPTTAVQHFVAVGRDVTERRRLDALAESLNLTEQVGFVFATLRHELGNPINSMKAGLSVLREQLGSLEPAVVGDYVNRLLGEVGRVEQLLRLFKSFSSFDRLRLESLPLAETLLDFSHLVADDLARRRVQLELAVDPEAGSVLADVRALNQVLLNLVTNAAEAFAGQDNGAIRLAARGRGPVVEIEVADNGPGMAEDVRALVFRPFYTTKPQGSGLGLAVVRRLLAKMGGTVEIASRPGRGTRVVMILERGRRGEAELAAG